MNKTKGLNLALSKKMQKVIAIEYEQGNITIEDLAYVHKVPVEELSFLKTQIMESAPVADSEPTITDSSLHNKDNIAHTTVSTEVITMPKAIQEGKDLLDNFGMKQKDIAVPIEIDINKLVTIKNNILCHLETESAKLQFADMKYVKDLVDSLTKLEASIKGQPTNDTVVIINNLMAKFGN